MRCRTGRHPPSGAIRDRESARYGSCLRRIAAKAPPTRRDSGYVAVPVDTLKCLAVAPVDVFVRKDDDSKPVLYCRAGYPLASSQFLGLADAGVKAIHVRADDFRSFGADLLDSIDDLLEQDTIPETERFAALQTAVSVELEQTSRLIDCGKYVSLRGKGRPRHRQFARDQRRAAR